MHPLVIPAAGVAVLGGAAYAFWKSRQTSAISAAFSDIADRVAVLGPRGEYAFKGDSADSIVRQLAQMTFAYPDSSDQSIVEVKTSSSPVGADVSALAWATRMNSSHSVLAAMTLALPPKLGQQNFLRAVDGGKESSFAGPSSLYAVLLYPGTMGRGQKPPGSPPSSVLGEVPVPLGDAAVLADELPQALASTVLDLLRNGQDPAQMRVVAGRLDTEGFPKSAAILRKRAAELEALGAQVAPQQISTALPPAVQPAGVGPLPGASYSSPPTGAGTALVTLETVNVYDEPHAGASALDFIAANAHVTQIGPEVNGFTPVHYDPTGLEGYVATSSLRAGSATVMPTTLRVVAPNGLNVRATPSASGTRVGGVSYGQVVGVAETTADGWTRITSPMAGYVCNTCSASPGGPWLA